MRLYQKISRCLDAIENCNNDWVEKHIESLEELEECLPHGSGFDSGCTVNIAKSINCIFIDCPFHVLHENGYYSQWIDFSIVVKPSLSFDIKINIKLYGVQDRNINLDSIKEYILDTFHDVLTEKV